MKIRSKFKLKQRVESRLSGNEFFIDRIQISTSEKLLYGCVDGSGDTKWFNDYELTHIKKGSLGFNIEINETKTR